MGLLFTELQVDFGDRSSEEADTFYLADINRRARSYRENR
jgi:hypothetical protein